ncbi:type II toxin-antitoxin system death-on-curing family toxin [Candidatus Roizmanbacteria bacterium CG_4_9_14_3_um_filter_33_18]|uniref:Type II toxin-antitoxin system death-on-curing family toxin n=1 Tax=Candidatus Roizmanbacteria bacterium CG_4_9_14_3_um_filter_33_18 TaxID=1974841 RepID=A0A2M7XWX0_9BACT|nr:MAG: type II toxin-antitoxin system death-on-curing family toxin [Candidatus Roizmanbacteria bacterium CG_4_9_14_3_um_filter_33_18]
MGKPFRILQTNKKEIVVINLSLEQILLIHEDQINSYGGSHGLQDVALFESAVYRSHATFGGIDLYPSIYEKAGALVHSLLLNHPFVDGNKRTAMASMLVFLEINGYLFSATQKELVKTALSIENKKWNIKQISLWLQKHSKKIRR